MARPVKLTAKLQRDLCTKIALPLAAKQACALVGLGYSTYGRWMAWGAEDFDPKGWKDQTNAPPDDLAPFQEFRLAVERAKAQGIERLSKPVLDGIQGRLRQRFSKDGDLLEEWVEYDHGAALKLMAALAPHEYGNRQQVEVTGKDGGAVEVIHNASRELDRRLADLASRLATRSGDAAAGPDAS